MKTKTLLQGGLAVGAFLLMIRGVMKSTSGMSKDIPKFGTMMLSLTIGLLAMSVALKVLASINDGDLVKAGIVTAGIIIVLKSIIKTTNTLTKGAGNAAKVGLMILSFAASIVILTGAISILSLISPANLAKAILAIAAVGGIFAGMVALTKYARVGKSIKSTIMGMTIAVGVLAISIAALFT